MQFREKTVARHPLVRTAEWLGLMVLCFTVLTIVMSVHMAIAGNLSVGGLRLEMVLQTLLLFCVPALLAVRLWSSRPAEWLLMRKTGNWQLYLLAFVLMVVAQPGINLLATWNESWQLPAALAALEETLKQMEESAREATELLAQAPTFGVMLINLLVMALVPALCEEISFRGVLLGLMDGRDSFIDGRDSLQPGPQPVLRLRTHIAIWVVGIIFSLIHFQFYGFVPRMLLGVVLGYLIAWTGSIWVPVLAHFTNNALVVILYYIEEHTQINADSVESFGTGTTAWVGVLSLVAAAAMLWLVRSAVQKQSSAPRQEPPAE